MGRHKTKPTTAIWTRITLEEKSKLIRIAKFQGTSMAAKQRQYILAGIREEEGRLNEQIKNIPLTESIN